MHGQWKIQKNTTKISDAYTEMKKLFKRKYKVEGSTIIQDGERLSGKVVINSKILKHYIGKKVKVYVYGIG